MTEINQKILDMIAKNASVNEISKVTGLSNKQLFYRLNMLKIKGYNFSRKYYYDGEICYKLQKGFETVKDISLITRPEDTEISMVFISDLHLSNKRDRVDLLNKVYNFCIKEGIHTIINGGDIIDGLLGYQNQKKFKTLEEQVEYMLKVYPYDKNILNFICLGNHDYNLLATQGQNLETIFLAKRHDIVSLGYGKGVLNIKNDKLIVLHPTTPTISPIESINDGLMLKGHYHNSKNIVNGNLTCIQLPSLSNVISDLPGFIKAKLIFSKGIISDGVFEQYVFMDKIYKVNESNYQLGRGKTKLNKINNEENRAHIKLKK